MPLTQKRLAYLSFSVNLRQEDGMREEARVNVRDFSQLMGSREYTEFFFCLESSTCRSTCGTVVARTTRLHTLWFEGYWFSICILPIVGHASFRSCKPLWNREADPPLGAMLA